MKKINRKAKLITLISITIIVIILVIVITKNIEKIIKIGNQEYFEMKANAGSNIVANYIKAGLTIGGITGTYTKDATATAEDILEGKTAYVNGEKITGTYDQNSTIIDLGIGRTFDLTGYSNYKEFTTDNFICEPINNSLPKWAGDIQGPRRFGSGINFSKNYNQETGILSATAYAVTYYMNSSNQFEGTYATSDFDVHAYLIK